MTEGNQRDVFISHPENPDNPLMMDLRNLSADAVTQLAASVRDAHGTIQLWVHSHYGERKQPEDADLENWMKYKDLRDKMIEGSLGKKIPIISFVPIDEDKPDPYAAVSEYRDFYRVHNQPGQPAVVYYALTFADTPAPFLEKSLPDEYSPEIEKSCWDNFDKLLKKLGVKHIILRGKNFKQLDIGLWIMDDALREYAYRNHLIEKVGEKEVVRRLPYGCVGYSLAQLENRGYKVSLSRVVYTQKLEANEI